MRHILLVEPSQDLGTVIVRFLDKAEFTCDQARSAQDAISLADTKSPDAVVLELALPGHNGVEFLYEFRSHADWSHVPVIFYSQISADECGLSKDQMQSLGIAGHLYKPTTPLKTLQNTLLDVLHEAKAIA